MFGKVKMNEIPPEICYGNCPRVHPPVNASDFDDETDEGKPKKDAIPDEYNSEVGKQVYPIRLEPCYILFRLTRQHCRSLRNYIISNSSKLEVIDGLYCGIATKLFNINTNNVEPNQSFGLLKFKTTDQGFRFFMTESRLSRQEFLGGAFDIWNISLCAPDKSIEPNPANPSKMVNSMNVFHFIHIKKISAMPDDVEEMAQDQRDKALAAAEADKKAVDEALKTVENYEGRLVVQTDKMRRLRGQPLANADGEPQKFLYMTQWVGVQYFWKWFESEHGRKFLTAIKDYTGGDYQSLLFTSCLDFHDLI